ncbi:MAG: 2-keto-4-pentenoate hydratase [Gammaproteobacteria bacterium]
MTTDEQSKIAEQFAYARQTTLALADFPGVAPTTLDDAYVIQDVAIDQWPDSVAGWKVGKIPDHLEEGMGCDRLAGPIFKSLIHHDTAEQLTMPVYDRGFAAIEAEYLAVMGSDAEADKLDWTLDEALAMMSDLRIGIEIASSPLANINDYGPTVVVSDFGNNAGLIVGPSISDWRTRDTATMGCESFINDDSVGTGGAFTLVGGFLRSVQFMLETAAKRGRPMKAGDIIATGQTNGIHEVQPGQSVRVSFGSDGELACEIAAASPAG